jgi:hypothetical protein
MCPACAATVVLLGAGVPTMGGLTALGLKKFRAKVAATSGAGSIDPETQAIGNAFQSEEETQ